MTATTALTAQSTQGVQAIHHVPPEFVTQQIDACLSDIGVDVVKVGMLASADTVDAVARSLDQHGRPTTVVDPVMVSTSGAQLLPNEAIVNLRLHLLPVTTVLTPNVPEARLLLENAGLEVPTIQNLEGIVKVAKLLHSLGPEFVLVKGGHIRMTKEGRPSCIPSDGDIVVDVLFDGVKAVLYETDYLPSQNTHGTGCSLACENPAYLIASVLPGFLDLPPCTILIAFPSRTRRVALSAKYFCCCLIVCEILFEPD